MKPSKESAKISKRKHGKSRLERCLEASIRQELWIKSMKLQLAELSVRVARVELK